MNILYINNSINDHNGLPSTLLTFLIFLIFILIASVLAIYAGDHIAEIELTESKNFGEKEAVITTGELVRRTNNNLRIVTDLSKPLISSKIKSEICEALSRGVFIRILYFPHEDNSDIKKEQDRSLVMLQKLMQNHRNGSLTIRKMVVRPKFHFWVGDHRHVRLEYPHDPGKLEGVTGKVYFNTLSLADSYANLFNKFWNESD